jgi:regulatory protein
MQLTREVFETCRERALGLLDQRAHSAGELRAKLLARGFAEALVTLVVDDLRRSGLINDLDYATAFCQERMRGSRPAGPLRLKAELLRRHVPGDLAEQALDAAMKEAGGADHEFEAALAAGRAKWAALRRRPSPDVRRDRERLLRFLAGRGFGAGIGYRVLEALEQDGGT